MNPATAAATEILMPRLSDSMQEGTILSWLIETGQPVAAGEDLVEIETDKANMTHQAEASGVLEIIVAEGETVPVGAPIARVGGSAEGQSARPAGPVTAGDPPPPPVAKASSGVGPPTVPPAGEAAEVQAEQGQAPPETAPTGAGKAGGVKASPLAKRLARELGVDLTQLRDKGSGPGGRIVKADVEAAVSPVGDAGMGGPRGAEDAKHPSTVGEIPAAGPAGQAPSSQSPKGDGRIEGLSRLQQTIARRMSEAKATVPHFQVETEVRMDAAIALRNKLKEIAGEDPVPSFNDLVVKAAALALREHPKANGSYRDGGFELHDRVNVGIAVAADGALVVPTIADADQRSLGEIGRESRRLAERVRAGTVTPPELAGGTFTVSNLGMFGITAMNPVINLPQAAILGVGASRQVLVRGEDGEVADAALMTLTLSCDHRILYGAEAAEFLAAIRDLLEAPLRLAL